MKYFITVKPNAKKESIEKKDESHYVISVKEPPIKGKANKAVIQALADYLNISRMHLTIIAGHKSRRKIIELK